MSEVPDIEIVQYREDMAKALADMYNSWDELWPTGFTQGVPFDADRVKKQFGSMSAIAILIALDSKTKKPLGSCTLHTHMKDRDAAYVGTLGVSPEALDKRIGKRLLLKSIEIARKRGCTRVDLNTWAGNTRAVPLYKKVGMMWNPAGQGLTMEDYIPGILEDPLCKPFFQGLDTDGWYDLHERELTQAPDDHVIDGMQVYPYRFRRGHDTLDVVVDRHARAITSIDRTIAGRRLRVSAKVTKHEALVGVPSKYTLEFENASPNKMTVAVSLDGFNGLHFEGEDSNKFILQPSSKKRWELSFHLDTSAPLHRSYQRTPSIVANLMIDTLRTTLKTGLVIRPTAEVRQEWGACRIGPGGSSIMPLTIQSAAEQPMTGKLFIEPSEVPLTVEPMELEFGLEPGGRAGARLQITAGDDIEHGTHDLWAYMKLEYKQPDGKILKITSRSFRLPVYCLLNTQVAVGLNDRSNQLVVVSDAYIGTIEREGAILNVRGTSSQQISGIMTSSQLGPPFGMTHLRLADRKSSVEQASNGTVVIMSVSDPERPLTIEDRFVFESGTGVIGHEVWVTNTGMNKESFQIRIMGRGDGFTFTNGKTYVPLVSGITSGSVGDFMFSYPAVASNPNAWSEGWLAVERNQGTVGQFWNPNDVEEIRVGAAQLRALHFLPTVLAAGETKRVARLWNVIGLHSWADVRRIWRARIGGTYLDEAIDETGLRPTESVDIEARPIVVPYLRPLTVAVEITKAFDAPMTGRLSVTPPENWKAEIVGERGATVIENREVKATETVKLGLKPSLDESAGVRIHRGKVCLTTSYESAAPIRIVELGRKTGAIEVTEAQEEGMKVFRVHNGMCEFAVSPDFGGCLFSIRSPKGTEYLMSSFPKPTPKEGGFMENYFGGVQPLIWGDEAGENLTQAPTNREKMSGRTFETGPWKGVEISWTSTLQRVSHGLEATIQYLTTPGSNLVMMRAVLRNKTSSPMAFQYSLFADPGFDGSSENIDMRCERDNLMTTLHPGQAPIAVIPTRNFLWLRRMSESLGFVTEPASARNFGLVFPGFLVMSSAHAVYLMPNEEKTYTSCLIIDPVSEDDLMDIEEAIPYLLEAH